MAEPISATSFSTAQIMALWESTHRRFTTSRKVISYVQSVQQGGQGVIRPDLAAGDDGSFDPAEDPLTTTLPERQLITLGMVNRFSADTPVIERRPIGSSPTARRDAELCGTWLNEALAKTLDGEECYAKSVEDAQYAIVVTPSTEHWEQAPDWMDTVTEDAYGRLGKADQRDYRPYADKPGKRVRVDAGGKPQISPRWYRDGKGNETSSASKRSMAETKRAYDDAHQAYLASKPPWVIRIVPALDCAPILVPGRGPKRFECRGLIIRTLYAVEELLRSEYVWDAPEGGHRLMIPVGYDPANTYGAHGQIYLYEAYLMVDNHPIVAYSVGGRQTARKQGGDQVDAVTDLCDEYGIERLFVHYAYGLHNGNDNPDLRGIPLLYPLAKSIVGAESLLTATNVHSWKNSFAGYYLPIDPNAPPESYLEQSGRLKKFHVPESGEVLPVPGIPVPAAPAEIGQTARYMIEQLLGRVRENDPDSKLEGQSSGHGLSVANDLERAAQRQIPEGVREVYEFCAESVLEICDALKRKFGQPVGLWINEELEPGADVASEPASRWRILELQDRWVGGVYKCSAIFPKRGNLAEIQLLSTLVQAGQASMDDLLEARGKESPQAEKAKIDAEKILTGTAEGQLAMLANALRWRGETEKAAQIEAQLAGKLSQFGVPTAAMQGPPQAPQGPPQGGPPGANTQLPNIAASALGGQVAGAVGQASLLSDARAQMAAGVPPMNGQGA